MATTRGALCGDANDDAERRRLVIRFTRFDAMTT